MNIISHTNNDSLVNMLADKLNSLLAQKKVLWMLTGGRSIPLEVNIMSKVSKQHSNNLTIVISDERYGLYDHPDSNWYQLKKAGFNQKQAIIYEILQTANPDINITTDQYNQQLTKLFQSSNYNLGLLGLGDDGHIAGILPHSPAIQATSLVTSYMSKPFQRITTTFSGLTRLQEVYVLAFGQNKRLAVSNLVNTSLDLQTQPAQIVKSIKNSTLISDQLNLKEV